MVPINSFEALLIAFGGEDNDGCLVSFADGFIARPLSIIEKRCCF
jgi:hypothetical protein